MDKVRVALIGCGRVARVHAAALARSSEATLALAVDIRPERAEAFAAQYGCQAETDWEKAINRSDIDAVEICTPHYLHAPMTIAAAEHGKHILTEKPMALRPSDADAMIRAAKEHGVTLGVIFQNRYNTASQAARQAVDSGEIGEIRGARAFLTWNRSDEYYSHSDWKGTWDKEGGGVLIDQAIHTLDLVQWLMGPAESVTATYDTRNHDMINVDDVAEATIRFQSGATASLYANCYYPYDADVFVELVGTKGMIRVIKDVAQIKVGNETRIVDPVTDPDQPTLGPGYWGQSHRLQINDFYRSVREGTRPYIDGEEGKKAMELVLAMYQSARLGAPVTLPLVEPLLPPEAKKLKRVPARVGAE
ncbi:MAG: Gfo/Idh/MocA family oxidoreductase [Limnochordaceae bacterium]|nr:Gfo/Idh/MocA family oxidoreductase [Limnochordaceae bacterium]